MNFSCHPSVEGFTTRVCFKTRACFVSIFLCPKCWRKSQGKYLSFIFSVLLTHRRFTAAHVALPFFFLTPKAGAESSSPFYLKFMWESSDFYFPSAPVSLPVQTSLSSAPWVFPMPYESPPPRESTPSSESPDPHGWCKKAKQEHMRFVETHSRLHNHRDITLEKNSNNTKCFVCSLAQRFTSYKETPRVISN